MAESVNIRISPRSLLFFAVPTILVFVFQNIYSLVDSALASNLISTDALSAINIDAPVLVFTMAVGQMIAIGGSALIGKRLGEGRKQQARENFSLFMVLCIAISAAFCVAGLVFREPIIYALGARGSLYDLCEDYLIPLFLLMPVAMGGVVLSVMFILSGKPHLGLFATIAGGLINIVLDYVLMGILDMGVAGAAYASGIGYTFQTAVGLIYFMFNRRGDLYFVRPRWEGRAVVKAFANGSSEMVTSLAVTVKMIALNIILMDLAGSDGVAAGAIVVNIQMLLSAVYMGYSEGIAPLFSYNYGAGDVGNLQKIYRIALKTMGILSVITFAMLLILAVPLASLFAAENADVLDLGVRGVYVFSVSMLFMGYNIFASAMFTALNDGKTSAILSLLRTTLFLLIPLSVLPWLFSTDGVWASLAMEETLAIVLTVHYFKKKKTVFHYA
ncbi:MAG: hypothetical protein A3Q59_06305 [Methanomethylophilus alvi]|nr:MAG: hypothetical protein A3Q59_06305 [Methanomethylophilus alvi]WII08392.1 MATE family efflux transporter [Methanomassiliicoccales archaeon LGM-DZ1]